MGKIKELDFLSLANNIQDLMIASESDLLSLCSKPEDWPVPESYHSFVDGDEGMINKYREFLANRPMQWACLLRLLRERGLDESFLKIPKDLHKALQSPCVLVIPHFGLHMLVPYILGQFINPNSKIIATGSQEGEEIQYSLGKILPNDKTEFLEIPDIWILRKLIRSYKCGNYPLIYPELSSSNDKKLFPLNLLGNKVQIPMGVENLSRLCNARVVPVAMTYNGKYELHLGPTLSYSNTGSIVKPLFAWIQNLATDHPHQWFGWNLMEEMVGRERLGYE